MDDLTIALVCLIVLCIVRLEWYVAKIKKNTRNANENFADLVFAVNKLNKGESLPSGFGKPVRELIEEVQGDGTDDRQGTSEEDK